MELPHDTGPAGQAAPAGPVGLRERKKARTRAAIREHALRLFRSQGYAATTVEQVAAAAEVSPSTFFRYFPTKEDVVLRDDFDERVFEAFSRQPPSLSPVAAMRAAIREAVESLTPAEWAEFQEMSALAMAVPEVRARMLDELARTIDQAAVALAARIGKSPSDLVVRVTAGAVFGVLMAVMEPQTYTEGHIHAAAFERVDEALALLEAWPAVLTE
jgi:AcrR family transcriptional regulator